MTAQWKASDFAADYERMANDHYMQARTYQDANFILSAASCHHKGDAMMRAAAQWKNLARKLGECDV